MEANLIQMCTSDSSSVPTQRFSRIQANFSFLFFSFQWIKTSTFISVSKHSDDEYKSVGDVAIDNILLLIVKSTTSDMQFLIENVITEAISISTEHNLLKA